MPENLELNAQKVESQCASQLIGHYLLIHFLKTQKKLNPGARIVWVSSGGLYLKKLDLDSLFNNINYEKVSTYANVKRAQVTLVEELANIENIEEFNHYSMHPGWVDTSGLSSSLPQFFRLMKKYLRTPKQGSDTIIWLLLTQSALTSGGFYFDRKKVLPYFWSFFNPTLSQRASLMERIEYFKNIN
jgi:dehydrogenase/reductase SDR family protein 12